MTKRSLLAKMNSITRYVLPILGLTAAATFLARYQTLFMLVGLGTTLMGIAIMLSILIRERRKSTQHILAMALVETKTRESL